MKVANGVYKQLKINWGSVTLPLKEGSPVNVMGVVANGAGAIGLVPQTYKEEPLEKSIYILVGGDVDLNEVQTLFGADLATKALSGMRGINFHSRGTGQVIDYATATKASDSTLGSIKVGSGLSIASDGTLSASGGGGGVEFITETYDDATSTYSLDKTYNEISAMVEGGKLPVIISTSEYYTGIKVVTTYSEYTEDETTTYAVTDSGGREYTADSADGELAYIDEGSN